jgi:hypothetical protein
MKYPSRREFIHAGCAAGVATLLWPSLKRSQALTAHNLAPSSGHRAQVNLGVNNPASYGQDFPFIDTARQMTCWNYFGPTPTQDVFTLFNSNGYPSAIPAPGGGAWRNQTCGYLTANGKWILDWAGGAKVSISAGGGAGQPGIRCVQGRTTSNSIEYTFVPVVQADIRFTGVVASGIMTVTGASDNTIFKGQRISGRGIPPDAIVGDQIDARNYGNGTYQVHSALDPKFSASTTMVTQHAYAIGETFWVFIVVSSIESELTSIRFYRSDQAALVASGQITAPHFISFYRGYGCLRFMDWQAVNGGAGLPGQWNDRSRKTHCSWLGYTLTAYCGEAKQTPGTNDFTAPDTLSGHPKVWTDGMLVQIVFPTVPATVLITGFSNSNPAKVTAPAHGFSTGDHVFFVNGIPPAIESTGASGTAIVNLLGFSGGISYPPDFVITVDPADPKNKFTLDGIDSTNWASYVRGGRVGMSIRVATSTLPFKRVLGPDLKPLYQSVLESFVTGTNSVGKGTPQNLVYNAAVDALICTRGPADQN